jgi:eukaryotic-like serine/threonine-protein kinase
MQIGIGGGTNRFEPYEIGAPLGSGGMGEVYRAWDPRLRREVALKVLRQHGGGDPERVRRFVAEARAASALNHPNILTVFDASVDDETPYIVAELIEGHSLREEIRKGPVPIKRLLDLATQISDGLAEAHAAHIAHRDLKPENIMITRAGRAKIVDFGLAAAAAPAMGPLPPAATKTETLTEPALLVGTVPYMSPEQARGLPGDFRSDQFSLGLILYEMATGQFAFRHETPAATLDAIVNQEPVPLNARTPRLPFLVSWIVERCLAKNPDDRYAVTADLHRDLRTLRDRLAEASGRDDQPDAVARSKSALWKAAVVVLLLALMAAGTIAWRMTDAQPTVDLSGLRFRAIATGAAYEGLPAFSPDGQIVAYSQDVDGVLQIFTRRLDSDTAVPVTSCPYDCKYPFWSPDGKRLYYVSLAGYRESLWSISVAGGSPHVVVENVTRAALSPDGRTLAFLRDEQRADTIGTAVLWLATLEGAAPWSNEAVQRAARRYDPLNSARFIEGSLAFSPDGRRLALCGVPGTREERMWQFWVIPLAGGEPRRRLQWWSDPGPRNVSFTWFPDGRHVALGVSSLSTPGSHLWIGDLEADRVWPLTRGADTESYPSVAAQAGDRIVFTRGEPDYDLVQIPLAAGAPVQSILATLQNESDPALTPDGNAFAYVTDRNGQDEIWLRSRDGSSDRPLITQRDFGDDRTVMLSGPTFSPNGRHIAYQRNGFKPRWPLRIWISMVDGGAAPLLPASYEGIQSAPSWSPDGQWIAFAQWKGTNWELAKARVGSGEDPVVLRRDGVANAAPHWSPVAPGWITWETENGLVLVSPDGTSERPLSREQWLVHAWSRDGSRVLGIKETGDLKLAVIAVSLDTREEKTLAELGRSFAFNNPVKGFTLLPGARAVATSLIRPRGDLWLAEGLHWRRRISFP